MRSFLVVEKGDQLLIKRLEKELLEIKASLVKLMGSVQLRNSYIEQLKSQNIQLMEKNQYLIENLTTPNK
jgi:hypothetical protein